MGGNYFNFAQPPSAGLGDPRPFVSWLARPEVREALHVGSVPYAIFNQTVETQLLADWMVGVVPQLQVVLDHYRVLIYSGQNDVILGPPGTERAVNKLQWSGSRSYAAAKTEPMYGPSVAKGAADLMGYARRAQGKLSNFTCVLLRGCGHSQVAPDAARWPESRYVLLRGCGHMVPADQPVRAYEMLRAALVPMAPLPLPAVAAAATAAVEEAARQAFGSLEKVQGGANAARSPLRAAEPRRLDVGPCGRVAC